VRIEYGCEILLDSLHLKVHNVMLLLIANAVSRSDASLVIDRAALYAGRTIQVLLVFDCISVAKIVALFRSTLSSQRPALHPLSLTAAYRRSDASLIVGGCSRESFSGLHTTLDQLDVGAAHPFGSRSLGFLLKIALLWGPRRRGRRRWGKEILESNIFLFGHEEVVRQLSLFTQRLLAGSLGR
jgi:hypothetical protein